MPKGRLRGCPVNVRNWIIEVWDRADNQFRRVYGLTGMTHSVAGETREGSAFGDLWKEPYITKRGVKIKLEGRPVVEASTGERDAGQELLDGQAELGACCADTTLRFTDPYGHAFVADFVVTAASAQSDEDGDKVSWELEQVGEAEPLPYAHVAGVSLTDNGTPVAGNALSLAAGSAPRSIGVVFSPENASNKRYRVSNSRRSVAAVSEITEAGFTLTPLAAGSTTLSVVTVEGERQCGLTVNVVQ